GLKCRALDELHSEKENPAVFAGVVNGNNIRMIESAGRPSFVLKSPRSFVRSSTDAVEANGFERDLPANSGVERFIHHSHGSMANLTYDLVSPKLLRNRRHRSLESNPHRTTCGSGRRI